MSLILSQSHVILRSSYFVNDPHQFRSLRRAIEQTQRDESLVGKRTSLEVISRDADSDDALIAPSI